MTPKIERGIKNETVRRLYHRRNLPAFGNR